MTKFEKLESAVENYVKEPTEKNIEKVYEQAVKLSHTFLRKSYGDLPTEVQNEICHDASTQLTLRIRNGLTDMFSWSHYLRSIVSGHIADWFSVNPYRPEIQMEQEEVNRYRDLDVMHSDPYASYEIVVLFDTLNHCAKTIHEKFKSSNLTGPLLTVLQVSAISEVLENSHITNTLPVYRKSLSRLYSYTIKKELSSAMERVIE